MSALIFLCGVGLVGGICLALSSARPTPVAPVHRILSVPRPSVLGPRLGLALLGAILLGGLTGWPVAALAGGALGFFGRELLAPRAVRQAPIELTEAVAVWTEQLRDTMAGAAGLQQAIAATAPLAPEPIRSEVRALAVRAGQEALGDALGAFAEQVADPTADLVVSALSLAAEGEAQGLGEVLSALASSARDNATMRRFVDASRARNRTAVRAITAIALATLFGLLLLARGYLHPYGSGVGQVVLAAVLACYGGGVALLHRMGREHRPERLFTSGAVHR